MSNLEGKTEEFHIEPQDIRAMRQRWETLHMAGLHHALNELKGTLNARQLELLPKVNRLYQVRGFQIVLAWMDGEKDVQFDKIEPPYYGSFE